MKIAAIRQIPMRHLVILCALSGSTLAAPPPGPMATLKAKNDQVDSILRTKVEKDSPGDKKNKDDVKAIAATLLDYDELAKRAMADHWDQLKPAQQKNGPFGRRHSGARAFARTRNPEIEPVSGFRVRAEVARPGMTGRRVLA